MKQKKFLSLALVLAMMLSLLSVTALARDFTPPLTVTGTENEDYEWLPAGDQSNYLNADALFILKDGVTVSGGSVDQPANVAIVIGDVEEDNNPTNLTLNNVHIKSANPLKINKTDSNFTLNIAEGSTNSLHYYKTDDEGVTYDKSGYVIADVFSNQNCESFTITGGGTLNVYGGVSLDYAGELIIDECTVNVESEIAGISVPYSEMKLQNMANLTVVALPYVIEAEAMKMTVAYPAVMAASLAIDEDCSMLLRGDYFTKIENSGVVVVDMPICGAIIFCCEEELDAVPEVPGLLGSTNIDAEVADISSQVAFEYYNGEEYGVMGYIGKVDGDFAKAVKFTAAEPQDDDPEEKPSFDIDFTGIISRILELISWKKVTDDVKTVSILTLVLEFIKRIIAILRDKIN